MRNFTDPLALHCTSRPTLTERILLLTAQEKADDLLAPMAGSLSSLLENATKNRKENFRKASSDPSDQEARDAYYYEEGRTRAYAEAIQWISQNA